jgi:ATP phosphoribosyltransferase
MFKKAGYHVTAGSRSYYPRIDDPDMEPVLIRAQEMAIYVKDGILDCGLTGKDWIIEQDADDGVVEVAELRYAKEGFRPVRWVVAVPESSSIQTVEDLQGKRIATELVNFTKKFLAERKIVAHVDFSWGATEVKAPQLCDAIVELTETGTSLRANNLRIIDTVLESTTRLIASPGAWEDPWKREKIENLALLLQGAIDAEERVGLKMNLPRKKLVEVLAILPAMQLPTISPLTNEDYVDLDVIIKEKTVRDLIPALRKAGATGIVEYPLNKVIP